MGLREKKPRGRPTFHSMFQSHHRAGKSNPTSLNWPEVPEEVDTAAILHRGRENSRCFLKVSVGRKGRFSRSAYSRRSSGRKEKLSSTARYFGQWA